MVRQILEVEPFTLTLDVPQIITIKYIQVTPSGELILYNELGAEVIRWIIAKLRVIE